MTEIKAVEYYPSNKGLKNIYSKFLKFGSTEDFDNLILFYTNIQKTERIKRQLNSQLIILNIFMGSEKSGKKNDFQDGKLRWDLLPLEEIEDIVKLYTAGSIKYGDNNWQGLENGYQRYKAAMLRHLLEYEKGNKIDEETKVNHLAAVAWNAIAMLYLDKHGKGKVNDNK